MPDSLEQLFPDLAAVDLDAVESIALMLDPFMYGVFFYNAEGKTISGLKEESIPALLDWIDGQIKAGMFTDGGDSAAAPSRFYDRVHLR